MTKKVAGVEAEVVVEEVDEEIKGEAAEHKKHPMRLLLRLRIYKKITILRKVREASSSRSNSKLSRKKEVIKIARAATNVAEGSEVVMMA